MSPRASTCAALAATFGLALVARGQDQGAGGSFEERLARVARDVAPRHVALSNRLEKQKRAREAWEERRLALGLVPRDSPAGLDPALPPPPVAETPLEKAASDLARERATLRADAAARLAEVAEWASRKGQEADARRAACLALDESVGEERARSVLGQEKDRVRDDWASARERKVRAAFERALSLADTGEKTPGDDALEKRLGMGKLARRETRHAVVLATPAARTDLDEVARAIEATRAAFQHLVQDEPIERDAGNAPGDPTSAKPRFLVVASLTEHQRYCQWTIEDKTARAASLACGGTHGFDPPPFRAEAFYARPYQQEWASGSEAIFLANDRIRRAPAAWLLEGITRFFSGRIAGEAQILHLEIGRTMSKRKIHGLRFGVLRALARESLALGSAPSVAVQLGKAAPDMDLEDVAHAEAFADWALARERKAFLELARGFDPLSPIAPQVAKAFGRAVEKVDEDLRTFVREDR